MHGFIDDRQDFFAGFAELVFDVDVAGGNESMDARFFGVFEGACRRVDIALDRAGEAAECWLG